MGLGKLLQWLAFSFFVLAALVAGGVDVGVLSAAWLVPGGLAAWVLSGLV